MGHDANERLPLGGLDGLDTLTRTSVRFHQRVAELIPAKQYKTLIAECGY